MALDVEAYKSAVDSKLMIPVNVRQEDMVGELDHKAICVWAAFGFMLDRDTFFSELKWERPAAAKWYYEPKALSFDESVDKFAHTFETVVAEQLKGKQVILPLSGGLDSRTLAAAMQRIGQKPFTYSYKFQNSFNETKYGREIAKQNSWAFEEYTIGEGYLWGQIEKLSDINQCYSEFTHARQMAVVERLSDKGEVFLLGHWGDVLFDDMGLEDTVSEEVLVEIIIKKMLKKGGLVLAQDLWQAWGLNGDFKVYLKERVQELLADIKIENANARVRAFKSMYWATRWTNTNLQIFSHYHQVALPYYDERICKLVCETPEAQLAGRKIQVEYLKRYAPDMARIAWQDKQPYNLFNYHRHLSWRHLPWRIVNKGKRIIAGNIGKQKVVTRNWEIQFIGKENDRHLNSYLFDNADLLAEMPESIIKKYYNNFKTQDAVYNSHPVSMLLTFSAFLYRLKRLKQYSTSA